MGTRIAVCVYIEKDGKILAVSRKDNPDDFGLPGGKVEEGEGLIEAARREALEETGLEVYGLQPLFLRDSDASGYRCLTFSCVSYHGAIGSDESGVVKWVDHQRLFDGTFGSYNRSLYNYLQEMKGDECT